MDPHIYLSSYLVRPNLTRRQSRTRPSIGTRVRSLSRSNPRILSRLIVGLLLWGAFFVSVDYIRSPNATTLGLASTGVIVPLGGSGTTSPAAAKKAPVIKPKTTPKLPASPQVQTASVTELTPGPTGQSAPPVPAASNPAIVAAVIPSIYIAPAYTYANSYTAGQCTWYVAGRRQVPSNWGNANNWYYAAERAGWRVGTTPVLGSIAQTSAGYFGHVALVEAISANGLSVEITEMNYDGPYYIDSRWVPTSSFRYIY
jgi:surface antigen